MMLKKIAFGALCAIVGGVCATAGIHVNDWQLYAILGAMAASVAIR